MRKTKNIARHLSGLTLVAVYLMSGLAPSGYSSPPRPTAAQGEGAGGWTAINIGLPSLDVRTLAIDPANALNVYAGPYGDGVFKSADGGASWHVTGLAGDVAALAIDSGNADTLYAGIAERSCTFSDHRLFKSTDGGANWRVLISRINGCDNIHSLVVAPSNTNTLYVTDFDDATGDTPFPLIRSNDGGATWSEFSTWVQPGVPPFAALAIDPRDPNTLYTGGYENGVFKSTDGGATWSATGLTNAAVGVLAIDPHNPSTLYAAASGFEGYPSHPIGFRGLFKSNDGGASWFTINDGLSDLIGETTSISALVIHPNDPKVVYAGTSGGGVFKSIDGGASWNPFNDGLTDLDVRALATAPGNPASLYAATSRGVFKIIDNATSAGNPIDDAQFFVHQHYRDFLNREPDADGLAFWTNEIASCAADQQCIEVKRINDSAAFFLSIEFQQTGYLVYRLYKTSYGNLPDAPVPVRFNEFLIDTQQVGQGVAVNQTGWEQSLENNKQKFTADFVQRSRFSAAFPTSMTPAQFVDKLFANAGVIPSASDRADAINEFGATITTNDTAARARALRRVAENSTLAQQEFNRAFVLMQYFGYLRRNPNDSPEATLDFQGYNFWLNKLNSFDGNFTNAEMVKAFIKSAEYRQRFGAP
jgi:photosystem II stability/assembly factor-like uncharacterized protein